MCCCHSLLHFSRLGHETAGTWDPENSLSYLSHKADGRSCTDAAKQKRRPGSRQGPCLPRTALHATQ